MDHSASAWTGGSPLRVSMTLALLAILAAPAVQAGTPEEPEVADPAGDCQFAPGNHYADIVAAWISAETANDFLVNIQLAEWLAGPAAEFTGYTLQFTHQSVQWGVAAFYGGGAWEWSTARIDTSTGEMGGFNETPGSFDASSATMSILFPKSIFPHEGDDNKLTGFTGGTADFKKEVPFFIAGVAPPTGFTPCDTVQSSATYTFTVGAHTTHGSASAEATPSADAGPGAADEGALDELAAPEESAQPAARETQLPWPLAALALASLAALRRRTK